MLTLNVDSQAKEWPGARLWTGNCGLQYSVILSTETYTIGQIVSTWYSLSSLHNKKKVFRMQHLWFFVEVKYVLNAGMT